MSSPKRIWIDAWGGNWSPLAGGTQTAEYIRADTVAEMIRQAVEQEREACAKVCEGWKEWNSYTTDIAAAIRARGDA